MNYNIESNQQSLKNINFRTLEGSLNTKLDWYNHLKYSLGYHMPAFKKTSMKFIKDVLSFKKELLKSADVIYVNVPNYPELSVSNILSYVRDDNVLMRYLGIYDGVTDLPDKYFFYGVLGTIKNDWLTQIIREQQQARNYVADEEMKGDSIVISEQFLQKIQSVPHFSKKKGKALSMLKTKSMGRKQQVKRKRFEISTILEGEEQHFQNHAHKFKPTQDENLIIKSPPAKRMHFNQ